MTSIPPRKQPPQTFDPFSNRPMKEANIWLAIVVYLVISTTVAAQYGPRVLGWTMLILIGSLMLGFLALAWTFIAALERENRMASVQLTQVKQMDQRLKNLRAEAERSIFQKYLALMIRKEKRNQTINHQQLLDALSSDLHGYCGLIRLGSELLPSLGLLGTVVGMTLLFSNVAVAFEAAKNQEEISQALRAALSSLDAAFVTTLAGACGGFLLLRGLVHIAENGVETLMAQIAMHCELIDINSDEVAKEN